MKRQRGLRSSVAGLRRRFSTRTATAHNTAATENAVIDGDFIQKLDRLSLVLGQDLLQGLMGEHISQRRTSGIEFADYRQYSAGDDLRRVDWNAFARLGTLHVRQSQAEHDTTLSMLIDASPSMQFGTPTKFLTARRIAAGLGYIALAHLDSVIMSGPGAGDFGLEDAVPASADSPSPKSKTQNPRSPAPTQYRGRAQSAALFRDLQGMEASSVVGFDLVLQTWRNLSNGAGAGRLAVIISDLLLDSWQEGVRGLVNAGFGVTVLHLLSPEELSPPQDGDLQLVDSETAERLTVHVGPASLQEYHHRLDVWLAETEGWCRVNGARYVRVQSDWDVERTLLVLLRAHGVTA